MSSLLVTRLTGKKEVSTYLTRYAAATDWHFVPGLVDRRPAIIARDPGDPSGKPTYFLLLGWAGVRITKIRDFRHAPYVIDGAEVVIGV